MTASYVREVKHLVVELDDGTTHTYHNVSPASADAFLAAPSLEFHWKKYIDPVYLRVERDSTVHIRSAHA